ncbi:DUF3078 domain-containing protein [Viscerimonas tarda]
MRNILYMLTRRSFTFIVCIVFTIFPVPGLFAQCPVGESGESGTPTSDSVESTYSTILVVDSLQSTVSQNDTTATFFQRDNCGLIIIPRQWTPLDAHFTFRDTMFYNPAFLPVIFDGRLLPDNLSFLPDKSTEKGPAYHLVPPDSTFAPMLEKNKRIAEMRRSYYSRTDNMRKLKYSQSMFSGITPIAKDNIRKNILQELVNIDGPAGPTSPTLQKYVPKRRYWVRNGEHKIEIAQNHISDNWSKGGASSYYVQSYQKLLLNYTRNKITFNNTIEWRLGFQSTSGDTLRDIRVNTDNFRYYGVFGYKAYDNWSYSATLETITQLFNSYKENEKKRRSALFSPLDVNVGLGMSYNLNKTYKNNLTKKVKLSLNLAPLSMNFRYVMDDKVDETSFKLKKGLDTKTSWGSLVNADLSYNFNGYTTWTSRFKYLTDYGSVVSEFENRLDFAINRYFSTSFYLYTRYDENSKKDKKLKYFQFNELLSFGLNYKW